MLTKLLKLIELAPQHQTDPVATDTGAPIPSTPPITQAPSSAPVPLASKADPPPSAPEPQGFPEPAPLQPASQSDPAPEPISTVARCVNAHNKARSDAFARSQNRFTAIEAGAKAFRSAMPPLLGQENIRDFIACVAHGMLIGAIENKDATKLPYAAQVAFSAQVRTEPKRAPKSAAKATPSSPGNN